MRQLFSDLNLNGDSPVRVQPGIGEWGPVRVPSTAEKKMARITVTTVTISITVALWFLGRFFYRALMGIS